VEVPKGYKVRYVKGRGPSRIRGKTILIPEWETEKEKQESLAHEIAHIKLGHTSAKEGKLSVYEFLPIEIEAQKLGRKLLGKSKRLPPSSIAKIIRNTTRLINRKAKKKISIATVAEIFMKEADRLGLPWEDVDKAVDILLRSKE